MPLALFGDATRCMRVQRYGARASHVVKPLYYSAYALPQLASLLPRNQWR